MHMLSAARSALLFAVTNVIFSSPLPSSSLLTDFQADPVIGQSSLRARSMTIASDNSLLCVSVSGGRLLSEMPQRIELRTKNPLWSVYRLGIAPTNVERELRKVSLLVSALPIRPPCFLLSTRRSDTARFH